MSSRVGHIVKCPMSSRMGHIVKCPMSSRVGHIVKCRMSSRMGHIVKCPMSSRGGHIINEKVPGMTLHVHALTMILAGFGQLLIFKLILEPRPL